ncbi:MAG: hypothetical protein DRP30_06825 [Thermotoga sp.]|nr:MAG: hypothetical protein DRP30_06825 [Thermotoga sp.]
MTLRFNFSSFVFEIFKTSFFFVDRLVYFTPWAGIKTKIERFQNKIPHPSMDGGFSSISEP